MGFPVTIGREEGVLTNAILEWSVKNLLFSSHPPLSVVLGCLFDFPGFPHYEEDIYLIKLRSFVQSSCTCYIEHGLMGHKVLNESFLGTLACVCF